MESFLRILVCPCRQALAPLCKRRICTGMLQVRQQQEAQASRSSDLRNSCATRLAQRILLDSLNRLYKDPKKLEVKLLRSVKNYPKTYS